MATQPITLPFVMMFMWPIPLVWKTDTNVQYVTVVSPPEQIYAYMENPQPGIRAVDLLYICMKCYLDLLYSHWMYTLWTIKNKKKKKKKNIFQWKFNQNITIFIEENARENVVCEMASILYRPQCVNRWQLMMPYDITDLGHNSSW